MSRKRDKYPKGRRSAPVSMSKLARKKTDATANARRATRKQKDVAESGGRRKVNKDPRKVPPKVASRRRATRSD